MPRVERGLLLELTPISPDSAAAHLATATPVTSLAARLSDDPAALGDDPNKEP